MPPSTAQREVVERLFRAMQAGPDGEEQMMALFAADAVFIEPFSGTPQTHRGHDAIRANFRGQWNNPLPDLQLVLDRVDLDGTTVRADWTCSSPVLPQPMRGYDLFTLAPDGKINRLEIVVTEAPPLEHGR